MKKNIIGFVCFGGINTPIERLQMKHDETLETLRAHISGVVDGGLVIDDPVYETADAAYAKLAGLDLSCLVVCVAGWVPTHAVIRVTDHFRHIPMVLWGLCGRNISGTHMAHPNFRAMPICVGIGEAAGIAASISESEDCNLNDIPARKIREKVGI